jgi:hypothetical protein
MLGLCTIAKKDTRWGDEKEEQINQLNEEIEIYKAMVEAQ